MNLFSTPFNEDHLASLGFYHNSSTSGHNSNGVEMIWDGNKFEIYEADYRIWQCGLSEKDAFMQLVVKVIKNSSMISIMMYAGKTALESYQFNLHYGSVETIKEFKKIMKQIKMWDVVIKNKAANLASINYQITKVK